MEKNQKKPTIDDYLNDERRETNSGISNGPGPNSMPTSPSMAESQINGENLGIIGSWKLNSEKANSELKKAKRIYDTELKLLVHQAEAAERESKAFWSSKSAELAEIMKTYVRNALSALEVERGNSRSAAFMKAVMTINEKMETVMSSNLPESRKSSLMQLLQTELDTTLDRLKNEYLAEQYGLK